MTSRSEQDLAPLLDLGPRILDVALAVSRDHSTVGEPDPRWDRDSYETPGWLIIAAARRWPDEFFVWVRTSHVADLVTFYVAELHDPRAADYLLDVVRGTEPGASGFYRGEAIRALAGWRRPDAVEAAVAMLSATYSLEVHCAAEALEVLADESTLPALRTLAARENVSLGTLATVERTIARLERGEPFPDLLWFWVHVQRGQPPVYLVGATDSQDAAEVVEAFARSPRTHVQPPNLRADRVSTAQPPGSRLRPPGLPIYRGIHSPWEQPDHRF
jgi:hypothetical protein